MDESSLAPVQVILGCTGFTGSLVARYFSKRIAQRQPGLRYALAGRNAAKLQELKSQLGADVPLVVVDASSEADVERVARSTRVLLTTVGPYVMHGTPLVAACASAGTDYVDLNGEPGWHHEMIAKHGAMAQATNARMVPSSGFDSIPSDLGAQWMAQRMASECGQPTRRISCFVKLRGEFSGGTVASGLLSDERYGPALLGDPFLLGGARCSPNDDHRDLMEAKFDETIGRYIAPFGMATINTRIVRRSVGLLEAVEPERAATLFTPDFCYREVAEAPSEAVAIKMTRAAAAPVEKRKELVAKGRLPAPGQGPDEATRAKSWFEFTLVAESADGAHQLAGTISGGDPGYDETAKMVSEAAVTLATTGRNGTAGFLTPATAMGAALRETLHAEGIRFEAVPIPGR